MLKILQHPVVIGLFLLASGIYSLSLYNTTKKSSSNQKVVQQLEEELTALVAENTKLEERITQAQTPLEQEKIIRNELLLQKPGEKVIQIAEDIHLQNPEPEQPQPKTPWEEWQEVLF